MIPNVTIHNKKRAMHELNVLDVFKYVNGIYMKTGIDSAYDLAENINSCFDRFLLVEPLKAEIKIEVYL